MSRSGPHLVCLMDAKKELLKKRPRFELNSKTGLSTGSTLLNLACTDTPLYGLVAGGYYFLWGDSSSGKTWITMTCFAESAKNEAFAKYELHFINAEGGALMDVAHYFGEKVAARTKWHDDVETVQDFYRKLYDLLVKDKKKCIIVLDSQDALDNAAAKKKFQKQRAEAEEALQNGQVKEKGSYGDGKAKYHSENIRWVLSALRKTGSILWVIGQSRDNVASFGFADKKTKSGGKSLDFYANIVISSQKGQPIKKVVRGKQREVGSNCIFTVRKNRVTGKVGRERSAVIPIYLGYGIDDIGSVVDFLISEKAFKIKRVDEKKRNVYSVPEIGLAGTRGAIIKFIEDHDAHEIFQDMAAKIWKEIEDECLMINRKKRYE